ncbi:HlyD family secretion protein [Zymobacter sp. IVIA_12111.31 C1]|uniref:HlyD family secretion protein n=1 Tax=Zymobacter sp. IVIA_12111.31 C1 TaxID=3394854 RepID=UPI0039C19D72
MHALTRTWLKRFIITLVVFILLVVGMFMLVSWLQSGRFHQSTDNAYVRADSVSLRSEVTARVLDVPVIHNQQVKAGDVLVVLDPTDYQRQLEKAIAALDESKASSVEAARNIELQRATITQYNAQLASDTARDEQARVSLARIQELFDKGAVSRQRLDDMQADYDVAHAAVRAERAAIISAHRSLELREASLDRARATIAEAQAQVDYARHQLTKTRIMAPTDGVIGNVSVEKGTLAQPSQTLMTLVPVHSLYIVANYKETQITRMRIGQPVEIRADAYPDIRFTGQVESLAPATGSAFSLLPVDNATGNFNKIVQRVPVRIRLTGPLDKLNLLQVGLSVEPSVDTHDLGGNTLYVAPALRTTVDEVSTSTTADNANHS